MQRTSPINCSLLLFARISCRENKSQNWISRLSCFCLRISYEIVCLDLQVNIQMSTLNYSQPLNSSKTALCHRYIIEDKYIAVDYFIVVLTITLNVLACPPIILLNTLVIIAVRTKPRLQTQHNILLACMARTDLAVGIIQPAYIAKDILIMNGESSCSVYCTFNQLVQVATLCLCLISLFHLVLIALERYVAMKYSLRYDSIVTKHRLTVAIALSWLIGTVYCVLRGVKILPVELQFILMLISLVIIIFCHISVYLVSRRHMKQSPKESS